MGKTHRNVQETIRETRRWIRLQVIKRMAGPSDDRRTWLSDAVLAKTPNEFWIAWQEQDPYRIGLLPKRTPRTRGCLWLEDRARGTFKEWSEFIASGRYEEKVMQEQGQKSDSQRLPGVLNPAGMRPRQGVEIGSPRFVLTIFEAALAVGISESTLQHLVRRGDFPKPRQLSARRVGWLTREVEAWAESRPHSDLPPPPNTGAPKPRRK